MNKKVQEILKKAHEQYYGDKDYEEVKEDGQYVLYTEKDFEKKDFDERLVRTKVVRGGKRQIKFKSDKPGYKVQMVNGRPREVKIKAKERIARKKGAKKGAKKAKGKKGQAAARRKRSLKLRGR